MNLGDLRYVVGDIYGVCPDDKHKAPIRKIVNTIFKVIAESLRRGEKVVIRSFGTFALQTRKQTVYNSHLYYQGKFYPYKNEVPERKIVIFIPAKDLMRELNENRKST